MSTKPVVTFVSTPQHASQSDGLWASTQHGIDRVVVQSEPPETCTCALEMVDGELRDIFHTWGVGVFYEVVTVSPDGKVTLYEVPRSQILDIVDVEQGAEAAA